MITDTIYLVSTIGLAILLLASIIVLLFLWKNQEQLKEENLRLKTKYEEIEKKYTGVHAEQLRYKLNPHLFRNALNAIQSHAYQSYYALDKLSGVLDYILYDTDGRLVTIKEEIAFARNFIEINRLKTSPLFDIRIKNRIDEGDPRCNQAVIAPLTFINPIENAFKHADLQSDNAFISVSFSFENDSWFVLQVANKINDLPVPLNTKGGLGNTIYLDQLSSVYGEGGYSCKESINNGIFITELRIKIL
ncbi:MULTISPECIES: histidine kinase [Olivibacter]|jgi:LytS/YehU family sensor histidine kinase|uniref:Histidine kinase n=1 Tax=Olivibacter oleidegradans TaxID=760123 RepID=A0ABV6HLP8_9SPHI|nr:MULTISPECIES: sensor histidine kinase [Olivibacter]MDM8175595.1 histidine kinase [Olivibacter sp. 47]QEL02336.1 histidine kinase [Olivibacter sp. LS-1]